MKVDQVVLLRKLGLLAGKFTVPDSLMEEDDEINTIFYGNDDT